MYYSEDTIVYLDGKWLKATDANFSLYSQSIHYGSGVFEGIRSYEAEGEASIFKAAAHYERLLDSAKKMHIKCNYTVEELTQISYELLERNNLKGAYIRPLIFLGANMSLSPVNEVHLFFCAWKWANYLGDKLSNVLVSSYERPNPKSVPVEAKVTGHYTNSILATTEAKSKGFDEALLLDANGSVAEGSGANFFFERDNVLYTPPLGNILPGITRATTIEIAHDLGYEVIETYFPPQKVKGADGAFFTGTAVEIAGIQSLDGIPFKKPWEQTIGYKIAQEYKKLIRKPSRKLLAKA
ncbi:MAG: branched-chain amino acid aminotransferase [Cytophagales bacterium CG12_big_fil_rev_8_21_14_0_65_40_12]|nr:MAG: branched-chain amino acid aminotransferase [Cytophagales bacterium CG12_big_fil_rev_8_21_14_0_65_40_12]PIW04045.1 MAG: branched-chain amino acid aminotransferase [Cytophagales bacterium CG17_big_fil_post_rev_8_21_14_2_50_40_13]